MAEIVTARRARSGRAASVDRPGAGPGGGSAGGRRGTKVKHHLTGHAFLIGALLCFAFFSWWPLINTFILSFHREKLGVNSFVGWKNFVRVYHDPSFWQAWRNTLQFTFLALILGFVLPFFIAIMLNEIRHGQGYLRVLVYLPCILPPASALLLFKYAYDPGNGIFNTVLHDLHLPTSQWLQSPRMAMPSNVIASTWMNMGGTILIYLASLQGIPGELYEAAEIDGASWWRRIWHVTVPETKLILSLMFMIQIVSTMQLFVEPFILDNGDGLNGNTTSVVYLIYQHAFIYNDYGGAAALSVMLLLVLAGFSALYSRLTRNQD
jgi:multiple sugar transport system permease protein